ncbi:MAG: aminoglycoside phosphotransferase family protein [Cellulosilyticaceae bacterium]
MKEFIQQKIKKVFGEEYVITSLERLLGGAQKYVYLAKCENGFSFILYQWSEETTYFEYDSEKTVFRSSSATLFEENNRMMIEKGVLTPKLYFMDRSRKVQSYDYAFVEYIEGIDMDELIAKEQDRLPAVLVSLASNIHKLHQIKSTKVGQADRLQDEQFDIVAFSLDNLMEDCQYLIDNDEAHKELYVRAKEQVTRLSKKLPKRSVYTFIHGELGPNHVIVDKQNNAYLIDIESAKYCDIEEESSFIQMRFNNRLKEIEDEVDADRMLFYRIGHYFGNLRGAIELKQKNYYDMDAVNEMISFFHHQFAELTKEEETKEDEG